MNKRTTFSSLKTNDLKTVKKIQFLKAVTGRNVSIYTVTTMGNFSFEREYLNKYSKLLTNRLAKTIADCDVVFDTLGGLAFSLPALKVKVVKCDKIKYESLFLTLSDSIKRNSKSANLPVLCVFKETGIFTKIIHSSLEKLFNCSIRPCCISNNKFLWLAGIGINESVIRRANEGINISYSLPNSNQQFLIDVHLTKESLENIWLASRTDQTSNILSLSEINLFFNGLLEHIRNTYGFNFEECPMKSINMEAVKFSSGKNLQIFISSEEIAYHVLTFLHTDCTSDRYLYP